MTNLIEFHVSVLWGLKPRGIRQIITQLKQADFENAVFLFNARRNWFQITCQESDEEEIKQHVKLYLEEAEENALDDDESLVDDDGAVVKSMNQNQVIGIWDENARRTSTNFTEHRLPEDFEALPYTEVWELASYGSIKDILTREQFEDMRTLHNVKMATNHSLSEIYLGAATKGELDRVIAKLDVLAKVAELAVSPPVHLLWTEAYKERDGCHMTFDMRFLANIDPALIGATFLHPGPWPGSVEDYELLREAITVRLCRYDGQRGYHTSLIGPKLKAHSPVPLTISKRRYDARTLGVSLYGADIVVNRATSGFRTTGHTPTDMASNPFHEGGQLGNWLDGLEQSYRSAKPTTNRESSAHSGAAVEIPYGRFANNLIIADDSVGARAAVASVPARTKHFPSQSHSLLDLEDPFVTSQPVLIPMPSTVTRQSSLGAHQLSTAIPKTHNAVPNLGDKDVQLRENSLVGTSRDGSTPATAKNLASPTTRTPGKSIARPETAAAQLSSWFIRDINTALAGLVARGPYLRGKVDLRADLGRILITGMDYTGLAFNPPGTQSNGWKMDTLLQLLNQGSHRVASHSVAFTRMLSQCGADIESLLTTIDIATGQGLWKAQTEAHESVFYSFHCVSKGESFFLDVEADKNAGKFDYALRSGRDDSEPVWIHCTLRSWDVRVVMSQANTQLLEAKHGEFARSLIDCFVVTLPQDRHPQVQIGVYRKFGVSVESMRINTRFRVLSTDGKSYLDITEVEETVFKAGGFHPDIVKSTSTAYNDWMFYTITPKRTRSGVHNSEEQGLPTLWYEASVRSVEAEKMMAANRSMALGEKANWDFGKLSELGAVASLVKPALRMVQTMDGVGAHNNNHQTNKLVLPPRNIEATPGANYVSGGDSSASRSASQLRAPLSTPAPVVQLPGPPGTVGFRPPSGSYSTPSRAGPSGMSVGARPAAHYDAFTPGQNRVGAMNTPGSGRSTSNPSVQGASAANSDFGVASVRAPSQSAQRGRGGGRSSASSETSRAPTASYRPPDQFW